MALRARLKQHRWSIDVAGAASMVHRCRFPAGAGPVRGCRAGLVGRVRLTGHPGRARRSRASALDRRRICYTGVGRATASRRP
jgi:hypothetical protein